MAQPARHATFTLEDYLVLEERSNVRHEFLDGQIYAMAGGTLDHGRLCARVISLLSSHLEGRPCVVFTSDVRVRVQATGLDTYPDVGVVCGRAEMDPDDRLALANPVLLVEVTSPGTSRYDRGEKLRHYQRIHSLREILVVAHEEPRVEVWRRAGGSWSSETVRAGGLVALPATGCELAVDAIYHDPLA